MNPFQPLWRIDDSSSPARREKKGARPPQPKAKADGIDEGLWLAAFPHLFHRVAMGPFPLPLCAGEDAIGVFPCF